MLIYFSMFEFLKCTNIVKIVKMGEDAQHNTKTNHDEFRRWWIKRFIFEISFVNCLLLLIIINIVSIWISNHFVIGFGSKIFLVTFLLAHHDAITTFQQTSYCRHESFSTMIQNWRTKCNMVNSTSTSWQLLSNWNNYLQNLLPRLHLSNWIITNY